MFKYINGVPGAPPAIGPYSQAVIVENLAYVSGQIPIHPETGEIVSDDITAQAEQVMKNLFAVLDFMGTDFSNIVKATIYMTDLADFDKVNDVYAKRLGAYKPARATMQVAALPRGAKIEIELIAAIEKDDTLMPYDGSDEKLDDEVASGYDFKEK